MSAVRGLLAVIGIGLFVLAALPALDLISPSWVPAAQALVWVWFILAVIVLVVSLPLRAWFGAGASTVAIVATLVTLVSLQGSSCTPTDQRLSVLTLNAEMGKASVDELVATVTEHDVDVLVIAETSEPMIAALSVAGLAERFPYRSGQTIEDPGTWGTVILSRYPAKAKAVEQEAETYQQPLLSIDVDGTQVLVRGVHPQAPVPAKVENWRAGLRELGQWQRDQRGTPLVMAGDFNASPAHAPFRDASRGLASAQGRIASPTWPVGRTYPPFTDIDHVLVRGLSVVDGGVEEISGTDHRAVWADLRLCAR